MTDAAVQTGSWRGKGRCGQLAVTALLLVLALFAATRPALAIDVEASSRRVERRILALYDKTHENFPHQSRLHKLAEMPLNHLGYVLEYRDVNEPLPEGEALAGYRPS